MPRPRKANKPKKKGWGICVTHPDGSCGWLVGEDLDVQTYPTKEEAENALTQMKKNPHYTWSLLIEAKEFHGLPVEEE